MICQRCIRLAPPLRQSTLPLRKFTTYRALLSPSTLAPSPSTSSIATTIPEFSTPLPSSTIKPKSASDLPTSICPAGTPMKGLNYIKGKDDPVALAEEEYPAWLWRCLDVKVKEEKEGLTGGDEFSKSKKLRRKAAKAQRKVEAKILASGDTSSLQPKIPITKQSVDLPYNEHGTEEGAREASAKREELRDAMRRERRSKIKEVNFLKGM